MTPFLVHSPNVFFLIILFRNEIKWNYGISIKKCGLIKFFFILPFHNSQTIVVGILAVVQRSQTQAFYSLITMTIKHIYALSSVRRFRDFILFQFCILFLFLLLYFTFQFHITCDALIIQFSSVSQPMAFKIYSIFNSEMQQ